MNGFHYVADLLKPSFARPLISLLVRGEFCYQAIQGGHAMPQTTLSSTGVERTAGWWTWRSGYGLNYGINGAIARGMRVIVNPKGDWLASLIKRYRLIFDGLFWIWWKVVSILIESYQACSSKKLRGNLIDSCSNENYCLRALIITVYPETGKKNNINVRGKKREL